MLVKVNKLQTKVTEKLRKRRRMKTTKTERLAAEDLWSCFARLKRR